MNFRTLGTFSATVSALALFFVWSLVAVAAQPPAPIAAAPGAVDCVTRSQQGQQTLLNAMTALLGDDPAGAQFTDNTAFVPNELLVGGSTADIAQVKALVNGLGFALFAIDDPLVVGDLTVQHFTRDGDADNHTGSIRRIFCEIAEAQRAGTLSATAFAEPNYRISASQWWAAGSRWRDDNLSEYMLEHSDTMLTDFDSYANQWAWGQAGINLKVGSNRTISQTGTGMRVVLFDSSPFAETGQFTMTGTVNGQSQPLFTMTSTERLPQFSFANSAFPDHGPFVAGLVNQVAPAAGLELVRVLGNDDGRGTLADLLTALAEFYARNSDGTTLDLHGTIMNLSIGVHHPITPTFPTLALTDTFGLPSEVISLKAFLHYGYDHGALIIAAAGNDFAFGQADSPWSETPADYDFVVSVGGSTHSGSRSCFSNNGDLFAPAGDGLSDCSGSPARGCATTPTECLVSVVHDDQGATNASFGYWVGSSFAAPQVSGIAALVVEALAENTLQSSGEPTPVSPAQIATILRCGTRSGTGANAVDVIDVARTLSTACLTGESRQVIYLPLVQRGGVVGE